MNYCVRSSIDSVLSLYYLGIIFTCIHGVCVESSFCFPTEDLIATLNNIGEQPPASFSRAHPPPPPDLPPDMTDEPDEIYDQMEGRGPGMMDDMGEEVYDVMPEDSMTGKPRV